MAYFGHQDRIETDFQRNTDSSILCETTFCHVPGSCHLQILWKLLPALLLVYHIHVICKFCGNSHLTFRSYSDYATINISFTCRCIKTVTMSAFYIANGSAWWHDVFVSNKLLSIYEYIQPMVECNSNCSHVLNKGRMQFKLLILFWTIKHISEP